MSLPVSEANELAVGALISAKCNSALAAIAQAEAKDAEAAQDTARSSAHVGRRSLAAAVRAGEKAALLAALGWWRRDAELIKLKEFYQERRLKSLNLDKPWSPEGEVESTFSAGRVIGNADWS